MKMASKHFVSALVISAAALGTVAAEASDNKVFKFIYPLTALGSGDEIAGPGGARQLRGMAGFGVIGIESEATGGGAFVLNDVNAFVLEDPPPCGPPGVSTPGLEFIIQWPNDCVFPNDFVIVRFTSSKDPILIENAFWANASGDSIAPAIVQSIPAPAASSWGLVLLMTGLLGAGAWLMARRRRAVANA